MELATTLIAIEYSDGAPLLFPETPAEYPLEDAIKDILSGAHFGAIRAVYSVSPGACIDVSEQVADRVVDALRKGDFVAPIAWDFANYCSRDLPAERAA